MSARERIIQILSGPEASRIRFSFPVGKTAMTISSHTFQRVARAFRHGHIRINITNHLPAGIGAIYHPTAAPDHPADQLVVPPILGRFQEGLVMHECIHAFYDIEKIAIDARHEESAAYVVGSLFYRMAGLPQPDPGHTQDCARLVAEGLLAEYQDGNQPVPAVDDDSWNELMEAVRTDPAYAGREPAVGGSYVHDGVL